MLTRGSNGGGGQLRGRLAAGLAVALVGAAAVSAAWAAGPPAGLTAAQIALSTGDAPGSAIAVQGALKHGASITDAYERTLTFRGRYGHSRFGLVETNVFVTDSANVASDLFTAYHVAFGPKFGAKALRLVFTQIVEHGSKGKSKLVVKGVTTAPAHALTLGDSG